MPPRPDKAIPKKRRLPICTPRPRDWAGSEEKLWQAFVSATRAVFAFLESATPLRFDLTDEPDISADAEAG